MRRRLIWLLAVVVAGYWIVWYPRITRPLGAGRLACARAGLGAAGVLLTGAQLPFLWLHDASHAS